MIARIAFILMSISALLTAVDWPQWRGPNRDGISPETKLMTSWPAGGPPQLWKTTGLGEGYSAFSVRDGRLFTQGQRGNQEFVMAFDVATGKKVWETPSGSSYMDGRGNGPRGTPTLDGERLYALSAEGTLLCADVKTGKPVWTINLMERFRGEVPNWGVSESPLIDGDRVIVSPGGRGAAVVALEKATAKEVWKSQSKGAGYSSPIAVDVSGSRQYIVLTAEGAMGLAAKNGELLWEYNKISNRTANIATPIHHNGHVFLSTDYGTGCALLKLGPQGAQEVYFNRDMKNHYSSSVLVKDHLYGYNSQILTAMKFLTGEVAWRDRSVGKGSVTYADGHLYLMGEGGVVGLAEATPEGYKEKSRFTIQKGGYPTWTPLVIADGKMFLREQDNLYCYNIRAR